MFKITLFFKITKRIRRKCYNRTKAALKILIYQILTLLDSDLNVLSDQEIQAFREELVRPRSMNEGGGCGINVMFKQIYHNHI